jgi:hypothetical protein
MRGFPRLLAVFVVVFALLANAQALAVDKSPDLPENLVWLNTPQSIDLSKLEGRFVLLHFGIYSASNADLAIKDLKKLSQKYPNELAVVGIHAVKSFNQSGLDDIRRVLGEQNINYPVAADHELAAWKAFHVYALPTVILIAPDGKVIFRKPGEDVFRYVDRLLTRSIKKYEDHLTRQPLPAVIAQPPVAAMPVAHDTASFEPDSASIDVTQSETPVTYDAVSVDFSNFVGEKIKIGREYSRHVKKVKFTFGMPPKTRLLRSVKSYVRVFTKEGEQLGGLETPDPVVEIPIDQTIAGDRLWVEAAFYYVRESALVQYKGLLFEVPLADYPKSENIEINHNVPNS